MNATIAAGDRALPEFKTVLVVDDDAAVCDAVRSVLASEGYRIIVAAGVAQGRSVLTHRPVDLVMTDVCMPGGSGLDLLSWSRRERPAIPVIVMTAFGGRDGSTAIINNGAAEVLAKPLDLDRLLDAVARGCRTGASA
jgi:DNA-binding NtrC family response regulator